MSNKWVDIGTIRIRDLKDADGNPQLDDEGHVKKSKTLVFDPNVKVMLGTWNKETRKVEDYKEVDLGQYRNARLTDPMTSINILNDKGYLKDGEFEEKKQVIKDKGISYKVVIPPPEGNS